jgi:hypothetical protein
MNIVKNAEKGDEDLENCDVYDAHCVKSFASKNQNDENGVIEHTLQMKIMNNCVLKRQ